MNNPKLQLAIAKLLPEKIKIVPTIGDSPLRYNFYWVDETNKGNRILETEWLYVMHLVEQELSVVDLDWRNYVTMLNESVGNTQFNTTWSDWFPVVSATFNQRAEAMCKVKGITV
jgi:hypothetical protein